MLLGTRRRVLEVSVEELIALLLAGGRDPESIRPALQDLPPDLRPLMCVVVDGGRRMRVLVESQSFERLRAAEDVPTFRLEIASRAPAEEIST